MDCQSQRVLSNVCTVFVEYDQRHLGTEHAVEMEKLRAELVNTKIPIECARRVPDQTDREALYWQDMHHQLAAIVRSLQTKLASKSINTPEPASETTSENTYEATSVSDQVVGFDRISHIYIY